MLKCIGTKCPFQFSSDIYSYCKLSDKYIPSGYECKGVDYIKKRKIELEKGIEIKKQWIKESKKELDILKHLKSYIKKNQHLI